MVIKARCRQPVLAIGNQQGVVLVVTLIVLAIVSLLSLSSMKFARLEQLFAGNAQWQVDALALAETGLRSGEADITANFSGIPTFNWSSNQTDGYYYLGDIADVSGIWSGATGHQTGNAGSLYAVEYLGAYTTEGASVTIGAGNSSDRRFLYRVSGRGAAGSGGSRIVQSIYATTE